MDIQVLFAELRRFVRGCPEPTMQDALLRSARIFAQKTWLLRRKLELSTVALKEVYDLSLLPPLFTDEEIISVKFVRAGQNHLMGNAFSTVLTNPGCAVPGTPTSYTFIAPEKIRFCPVPDAVYIIDMEVITQPTLGSLIIPDELALEFGYAIGYGALEWLYRMPKEPWTDMNLSMANSRMFMEEIARGKQKAMYDYAPNQIQWQRKRFA